MSENLNAGFDFNTKKELITLFTGMAMQGILADMSHCASIPAPSNVVSNTSRNAVQVASATVHALEAYLVALETKLAEDGAALGAEAAYVPPAANDASSNLIKPNFGGGSHV